MIRRYEDGSIRFEGENEEAERRALRAILAQRRLHRERLFEANMRLLGEEPPRTGSREVVHVVPDKSREELWRAWRSYSTLNSGREARSRSTEMTREAVAASL